MSEPVEPVSEVKAAEIETALRQARFLALDAFPYFRSSLMAMTLNITNKAVDKEGAPALQIDKHMRVYAHPDYVDAKRAEAKAISTSAACPCCGKTNHHELAYLAGQMIQKMMHPMQKHFRRAEKYKKLQGFTPEAWAASTECEINDSLMEGIKSINKDSICLPAGSQFPSNYGMEDHKLAEEYYEILHKEEDTDEMPSEGSGGQGQDGGEGVDGEPGEDDSGFEGLGEAEVDSKARQVAEAVKEHARSSGIGSVPEGFLRWADATLSPPKVDWRTRLGQLVRWHAKRVKPGSRITSYRKLSIISSVLRHKVILPTYDNPIPEVSIVIDTSGSMGTEAIKAAMEETEGVCKALRASITVIDVDAQARVTKNVKKVKDIKIMGGGGTDMRVGITKALDTRDKPNLIVIMTDGFTPWPTHPVKGVAMLVCLVGDYVAEESSVPSFMDVVRVEPDKVKRSA